jgi:hypothetical protein
MASYVRKDCTVQSTVIPKYKNSTCTRGQSKLAHDDENPNRTRDSIARKLDLLKQISVVKSLHPRLPVGKKEEAIALVSVLDTVIQAAVLLELIAYMRAGKVESDEIQLLKSFVYRVNKGTFKFYYGISVAEIIVAEQTKQAVEESVVRSVVDVPAHVLQHPLAQRMASISKSKRPSGKASS